MCSCKTKNKALAHLYKVGHVHYARKILPSRGMMEDVMSVKGLHECVVWQTIEMKNVL